MTGLVRVELLRLRLRRAVLLLLLVAVAVPAVILAGRIWDTRPVSDDNVLSEHSYAVEDCVQHPRPHGVDREATDLQSACEDVVIEGYRYFEPLSLASERGGSGLGVVAVLAALLFLLGTTFVGHDWNTGSMSNQLLFEPRRGRIWAAKAIAVALVSFLVAVVVSSAYWLALYAVMGARDLTVADGGLLDSLAYGVRGAAFASAAAVGGLALTMLFRSTVATVGVLFVVTVAGGLLIGVLDLGERWQPGRNVSAIVKNGTQYWVEVPQFCYQDSRREAAEEGSACDETRDLTALQGSLYYGVPLLLAGAASVLSFRRRDV